MQDSTEKPDLKEPHPLALAFPAMSESERKKFEEDIEKHGVREPVILLDGKILDGWHRYQAARKLKIKCPMETFSGTDPVAFVISKNAARRHLKPTDRATAVLKALSMGNGNQVKHQRPDDEADPLPSVNELAAAADVSHGTAQRTLEKAKGVPNGTGRNTIKNKANSISIKLVNPPREVVAAGKTKIVVRGAATPDKQMADPRPTGRPRLGRSTAAKALELWLDQYRDDLHAGEVDLAQRLLADLTKT